MGFIFQFLGTKYKFLMRCLWFSIMHP